MELERKGIRINTFHSSSDGSAIECDRACEQKVRDIKGGMDAVGNVYTDDRLKKATSIMECENILTPVLNEALHMVDASRKNKYKQERYMVTYNETLQVYLDKMSARIEKEDVPDNHYIPFGDSPVKLNTDYRKSAKELLVKMATLRTEINTNKDIIAAKPASATTINDIKAICVSMFAKNEVERLDNFRIDSFQPYVISFYKKDGSHIKSPTTDQVAALKDSINLRHTTQSVLEFLNLFGIKSQYNVNTDLKKKVDVEEFDCGSYEEILAVFKIVMRAVFNVQSRGRALGMNCNIAQLLPTDEETSIY